MCGVTSQSGVSLNSFFHLSLREVLYGIGDALAGEHVSPRPPQTRRLQIVDHRQTNGPDRGPFLAVSEPQTTPFDVDLAPPQTDDLTAPAAGQRDQPEDLSMDTVMRGVSNAPEDFAERSILSFSFNRRSRSLYRGFLRPCVGFWPMIPASMTATDDRLAA